MTQGPSSATRASIPLAAAVVGAVVAGAATFAQDRFTPLGNGCLTAAAALLSAVLAHLVVSGDWVTLVVGLLLSAGLVVVAVAALQEEAPPGVVPFVGGCEPFTVYAQNRWPPQGANVRDAPLRSANQVDGYAGNELITLDGWVRTKAAYPHNPAPFDNDVWFHLANDSGWVSFAGVRADPTPFDPTGLEDDGGRAVPLDDDCSGVPRM